MWSASSITVISTASSRQARRSMRCFSRPGVATSTSTPRVRASICRPYAAPPTTVATRCPSAWASGVRTAATCCASSRVGTSTRARGAYGVRRVVEACRRLTIGSANASVLPDPVRARPRTSRPARASGSTRVWMAKGASTPVRARAVTSGAGRPSSAKVVAAGAGRLSASSMAASRADAVAVVVVVVRGAVEDVRGRRRAGARRRPEVGCSMKSFSVCGRGPLCEVASSFRFHSDLVGGAHVSRHAVRRPRQPTAGIEDQAFPGPDQVCRVVGSGSVVLLRRPPAGRLDLLLGLAAPCPRGALDALAGLEVLVGLEEVLDLEQVELRDVLQVLDVLHPRVTGRDAEDLVVAARLVAHPEHADRPAADQAAGERRLLEEHEGVERVAVLAQGALDEAVVVRVARRREQHPDADRKSTRLNSSHMSISY